MYPIQPLKNDAKWMKDWMLVRFMKIIYKPMVKEEFDELVRRSQSKPSESAQYSHPECYS